MSSKKRSPKDVTILGALANFAACSGCCYDWLLIFLTTSGEDAAEYHAALGAEFDGDAVALVADDVGIMRGWGAGGESDNAVWRKDCRAQDADESLVVHIAHLVVVRGGELECWYLVAAHGMSLHHVGILSRGKE